MNKEHLKQIINNYLDKFEDINGPVHIEYYKWQIANQFRTLMDDALNASNDEFSEKLYLAKKLTRNMIDSYTQPFNGLVEFSKCENEAETVRNMFIELFQTAEVSVDEKQMAIQRFLEKSHELRDRYYPGSYLFNDDLHSVTGYLFLYDPNHNYLYKASHCRSFADCIEFYDDWGYGANTKLDVFFRMCDSVLEEIKKDEALLTANAGRYNIDPAGMHPDPEKHILLFDLIYCCSSYGLFHGIHYTSPKSGERKLIQERSEKIQELEIALAEAQKRLALLDEATEWLADALSPGTVILHKTLGEGRILETTNTGITVKFNNSEPKRFVTSVCISNGLIRLQDADKQKELLEKKDLLCNDSQIRLAVHRAEENLIPYTDYLE